MAIALTHIALHVRDVEACVDFYSSYAGMNVIHERPSGEKRIVWLCEPGQESQFIIVILPGGKGHKQQMNDFSHLGFALESKAVVDKIAMRAEEEGILVWGVREDSYPAGYYCGVRDPDGNFVEFSYGQPLGPGAPELIEGEPP
ncbi:conserved protein of unknown function [Shewanella benthica]|uniref:VOC domain-containing protein n=1 Tax=Shewanella benthica TaxID=43661 RepID=A0A330M7P9_9GAMM|nr:VOC family protein [Shewanella benthica]SQH78132.1 conserved protein of unknown function [Shewanella benthica]